MRHRGHIILLYVNRLGTGNMYQSSEPLGLKALAAFVEAKGYSAYVFSGSVHEAAGIVRAAAEKELDAVGLYCDFETVSAVESFSRFVKDNSSAAVFVGGPQAIALEKSFIENSRCDAVVRGEGETALYELLELFVRGRGRIEAIAGACYLDENGRLLVNPQKPPIRDLDALPARKFGVDGTSRRDRRNYSILTGRGCPFSCAFCYEGSAPGGVRLRSVENSIAEIRNAIRHDPEIRYVWFADDTFTLNAKRMESFSRELAKLRKEHDLVWFCECHPSTVLKCPEVLPMMVEAGLVRMQIGMESGSSRIISLYDKMATLDDILSVTRLSYEAGLPQLTGNMIIGGAAESERTFARTLSFAKELIDAGPGMTDITSTFFVPLPGTRITMDPKAFGISVVDPDALTSIGDMAIVATGTLSRERIASMRLRFTAAVIEKMAEVHRRGLVPPGRIAREFEINERYGIESNWYRAVFSRDEKLVAGRRQPCGPEPAEREAGRKVAAAPRGARRRDAEKAQGTGPARTAKDPKKIGFNTIMRHFEMKEKEGVETKLYSTVLSLDPLTYNYFTVLARGAGKRSKDIPRTELLSWRPQRTMAIWMAVDFTKGYPVIGNYVLSPLEYEFLLHCTGKSTMGAIYGILAEKFPGAGGDGAEFKRTMRLAIAEFERRRWIFFSEI